MGSENNSDNRTYVELKSEKVKICLMKKLVIIVLM